MQRILIIAGVCLLSAGILWPWLRRLPFGRLPGDIVIHTDNLTLFLPITTMILVSLALSLGMWLARR